MTKFRNKNSGFTLIELMVATSIFMMVVLATIGALMITSNAARESKALRFAMDNVNFAMDTMTRNIRLGSEYSCVNPTSTSGGSLMFVSNTADCAAPLSGIVFPKPGSTGSFDIGYQRVFDNPSGKYIIEKCDSMGCFAITSSNIDITNLEFTVSGSDPLDDIQPSVKILLSGTVTVGTKITNFYLQTLASQRTFE